MLVLDVFDDRVPAIQRGCPTRNRNVKFKGPWMSDKVVWNKASELGPD